MFAKLIKSILQIRWILIINQFLGFVLFNETLVLTANGFFKQQGFTDRMIALAKHSQLSFVQAYLHIAASNSEWLAPLLFIIFMLTSLLLMFCLFTWLLNWVASAIFFFYYISHLSYPGTWLFEYLQPLLFFVICAIVANRHNKMLSGRFKIVAFALFNGAPTGPLLVIYTLLAAFLGYCVLIANNAHGFTPTVAWISGVMFLIAGWLNILIDPLRFSRRHFNKTNVSFRQLRVIDRPWLDYLTLVMGIMLVCQVYMDQFLNWFTVKGYQNIIQVYTKYTHIPNVFEHLLSTSATYAHIVMPIQQSVEAFCALTMMIMVLRFPTILIAGAIFFALGMVELGIPATWPPTPNAETNWCWELLLPAFVAFCIGIYHMAHYYAAQNRQQRWMRPVIVFNNAHWANRLLFNIAIAMATYLVIRVTPTLGKYNGIFALSSALTVSFYLFLLEVIDILRQQNPNYERL